MMTIKTSAEVLVLAISPEEGMGDTCRDYKLITYLSFLNDRKNLKKIALQEPPSCECVRTPLTLYLAMTKITYCKASYKISIYHM